MGRGRHALSEREKLNRKLARLSKEIEEIRIKLAGKLTNDPIVEPEKGA